jgi:hypothetical protein
MKVYLLNPPTILTSGEVRGDRFRGGEIASFLETSNTVKKFNEEGM